VFRAYTEQPNDRERLALITASKCGHAKHNVQEFTRTL